MSKVDLHGFGVARRPRRPRRRSRDLRAARRIAYGDGSSRRSHREAPGQVHGDPRPRRVLERFRAASWRCRQTGRRIRSVDYSIHGGRRRGREDPGHRPGLFQIRQGRRRARQPGGRRDQGQPGGRPGTRARPRRRSLRSRLPPGAHRHPIRRAEELRVLRYTEHGVPPPGARGDSVLRPGADGEPHLHLGRHGYQRGGDPRRPSSRTPGSSHRHLTPEPREAAGGVAGVAGAGGERGGARGEGPPAAGRGVEALQRGHRREGAAGHLLRVSRFEHAAGHVHGGEDEEEDRHPLLPRLTVSSIGNSGGFKSEGVRRTGAARCITI